MTVSFRLNALVRGAGDPWVWSYVAKNLDKTASTSLHRDYKQMMKEKSYVKIPLKQQALLTAIKDYQKRVVASRQKQASHPQTHIFLQQRLEMISKDRARQQAEFFKMYMDMLTRKQEEQKKVLDDLVREMTDEKDEDLVKRLKDEQLMVRWLAIQVIGRKRIHVEDELIGMLEDAQMEVREAARQALVRLARGTDFGPIANAPPDQRGEAIQRWRDWLSMQDIPARK